MIDDKTFERNMIALDTLYHRLKKRGFYDEHKADRIIVDIERKQVKRDGISRTVPLKARPGVHRRALT